jgi:hypothetical protein
MAPDPTDERYEQARQRVEAKMGFFSHLVVFVVVNIVFLVVAGSNWLWVTLFWGIGVAVHGWQVFAGSARVAAWKEQQIQKELARAEPTAPATAPQATTPPPSEPTGATDPET